MKRKHDLFAELQLRNVQQTDCGPLEVDIEAIKRKVSAKLDSAETERKSVTMKSKMKVPMIAVAATLALGITAFAANGVVASWFSSSCSAPDYKSLPTAQQVAEDIGYEPVLVDSFANGYAFQDGTIVDNRLTDENGATLETFQSVSFDYEKDGDRVTFTQDRFSAELGLPGEVVETVGDTEIYYDSYRNKLVPPDYELTEADREAEASGELVFSYGSDQVELCSVQTVAWAKDGTQYSLLQIDGALSAEELTEMAEEILEK